MIMINKNQKCKVWMNENITSSYPMKRSNSTEAEAIRKIITLLEEKCIRITLLSDLFKNLQAATRFPEALKVLEGYLRANRMSLPTKFASILEQPPVKHN
jgi:hypothetical protein